MSFKGSMEHFSVKESRKGISFSIVNHLKKSITFCIVKHVREQIAKKKLKQHELETEVLMLEQIDLSPYSLTNQKDVEKCKLLELPNFKFSEIAEATNNFDNQNKLGEGGFGLVYKGRLPRGQEIAVKRLSKSSSQGLIEFMNEVDLISKLQHRNLVRLLGCCIDGEEKMLLYEFMPNKSLDFFLFDATKKEQLDWPRRYNIIEGIARGLLYLHRDSRLRIIHRDMKASNVLLDEHLNAKISDFGMARIFHEEQSQAKTKKVVGTLGYMSPEYAMEGQFSEKSDVFSFGVLLLEIVSGKKNNYFHDDELYMTLLGHAWMMWSDDRVLELTDQSLGDNYCQSEVLKCIQVGLLCVQEYPTDRPTMSSVISMLSSEISLPTPKQAAFFGRRTPLDSLPSVDENEICSMNDLTITELDCR